MKFQNMHQLFSTKLGLVVFGLVIGAAGFVFGYIINISVLASEQLAEGTTAATDVVCSGCIGPGDLAFSAVTGGHINDADGVRTQDIVDGHVSNSDIGTSQVTSSKIFDNDGVRTQDIVDGQVSRLDLASSAVALTVTENHTTVQIPPSRNALITPKCPSGFIATGGGFSGTDSRVQVLNNSPLGQSSWFVQVMNTSPAQRSVTAYVVCMDQTVP